MGIRHKRSWSPELYERRECVNDTLCWGCDRMLDASEFWTEDALCFDCHREVTKLPKQMVGPAKVVK